MTKKRTRLSPEDRLEQLLDSTKEYIVKEGLNSLTMNSVAKQAGVSKPLLYKYFDSRLELLQALLAREDERRYTKLRRALMNAEDYGQIIYTVVNHNFDERSRGDVWQVLADQPDIAAVFESSRKKRRLNVGRFLVKATVEEYDISKENAMRVIRMASAASIGASEQWASNEGGREELLNLTLDFIFGGLGAFTKK